jgi:ketosteroid isomerase-like protein
VGLEIDGNGTPLVRQALEGLAAGGAANLCGRLLRADLRWHEPGRSLVAGDYSGCEEVIGHLFARLSELSEGTFGLQVETVASDDTHAIGLYTSRATRGGLSAFLLRHFIEHAPRASLLLRLTAESAEKETASYSPDMLLVNTGSRQ